jgi:hypothetical protein
MKLASPTLDFTPSSLTPPSVTITFERETQLIEAIRRTIAYADRFNQAARAADIVRYLDVPAQADEVLRVLARQTGTHWLARDGLFCLPARAALLALTQQRQRIAQRQWHDAMRWGLVMAHAPFVRMIAVTGSLAMDNANEGDDIDYLVVTAHGRVWLTRLWLVTLVRLARCMGVELCPNYILSENALVVHESTFFYARELAQMIPLWGAEFYEQTMALNAWLLNYLPAATTPPRPMLKLQLHWLAQPLKVLGEKLLRGALGDKLETWERERKIARLRRQPGADAPTVILSAEQCKAHFRPDQAFLTGHAEKPLS